MGKKGKFAENGGCFWKRITAMILFLTLLSLPCCLFGCRKTASRPTDLFKEALDAEMTVETGDFTYRVTVHLGAVSETEGKRTSEVIFLFPESIAGMSVSENESGRVVRYAEHTVKTEEGDGLLFAALLLSPAEIVGVDHSEVDGIDYTVYSCADGRTVYTDVEDGTVRRIEKDGVRATVEWIEARG